MNYLDEKELKIVTCLTAHNNYVKAAEISDELGVTDRTVRSLIKKINSKYPDIISSSRDGYRIDQSKGKRIISENTNNPSVPSTSSGRIKYIFKKILISKEPINIYELADELCISEGTLQKTINAAKKELIPFDLVFHIQKSMIFIKGNEKNKQNLILKLIREECSNLTIENQIIKTYFPEINLDEIRSIISSNLKKYHCYVDDNLISTITMHIAVSIGMGNIPKNNQTLSLGTIDPVITEICNGIAKDIFEKFNYRITDDEIINLTIIFASRIIMKGKKINASKIDYNTSNKIYMLANRIFSELKEMFGLNLEENEFKSKFIFHLNNMFFRLVHHVRISNPQLHSIRVEFPFIYEVAVYIAEIIYDETGYRISEDEIGFIALHIGIIIEEQTALENQLTCGIVIPYEFINYEKALDKLNVIFDNSVIIKNVYYSFEEIQEDTPCDMYISFSKSYDLENLISITPFINSNDVLLINESIVKFKKKKKAEQFVNQFKQFCLPDFFVINNGELKDDTDVIETLGNRLIEKRFVKQDFKEEIYNREKLCPSSLGNVAITHTFKTKARISAVSVVISKTPIKWHSNDVNLVIMLSITEDQQVEFRNLFNYITSVIVDNDKLNKILDCKNYQDFINLWVTFQEQSI